MEILKTLSNVPGTVYQYLLQATIDMATINHPTINSGTLKGTTSIQGSTFINDVASAGNTAIGNDSNTVAIKGTTTFDKPIGVNGATVNSTTTGIELPSTIASRKVVLDSVANNNFQYLGFGVSSGTLDYMINSSSDAHVFYSAKGSSSSRTELFRIKGDGTSGVIIAGGGVTLNNTTTSYVPSPLDYYEEFTLTNTVGGPFGSTSMDVQITRNGRDVTVYFPGVRKNGDSISNTINFGGSIESRFLPAALGSGVSVITAPIIVVDNNTRVLGFVEVTLSGGNIKIYADAAGSNFTATSTVVGFDACSISWTV